MRAFYDEGAQLAVARSGLRGELQSLYRSAQPIFYEGAFGACKKGRANGLGVKRGAQPGSEVREKRRCFDQDAVIQII